MIYLVKPEPGFWRWFFVERRNDPVYKWIVRLGFGKWRYVQFAGLVVGMGLPYMFLAQIRGADPGLLWFLWYTRFAPVSFLTAALAAKLCMAVLCALWIKRRLRQQLAGEQLLAAPVSDQRVLRIILLQVLKLGLIIYPVFLLLVALHRDLVSDHSLAESLYRDVYYLSRPWWGDTWSGFSMYIFAELIRNIRVQLAIAVAPVCGILLFLPARTLSEHISQGVRWVIVMVIYSMMVTYMPDDTDFYREFHNMFDSEFWTIFLLTTPENVFEILLSLAAIGISTGLAEVGFSLRRLLAPGME